MALTVADKIGKIVDCATRIYEEVRAVKSPQEAYDQQVKAVKAKIDRAWQCFDRESNKQTRLDLQTEIVDYGGKLKELQLSHQATLEDAEEAYSERQKTIMTQLCDNLIAILGESTVKTSLQQLSRIASIQKDSPATSKIHARHSSMPLTDPKPNVDHATCVDQGQPYMRHASASEDGEEDSNKNDRADDRAIGVGSVMQ
ncbi:hypothetical protein S40293_10329 [Stachybotrys chartarum IBT 40293]|nr:hypothetical protein S40293_10329 [Stachybotrys chartarum IBT 40293]